MGAFCHSSSGNPADVDSTVTPSRRYVNLQKENVQWNKRTPPLFQKPSVISTLSLILRSRPRKTPTHRRKCFDISNIKPDEAKRLTGETIPPGVKNKLGFTVCVVQFKSCLFVWMLCFFFRLFFCFQGLEIQEDQSCIMPYSWMGLSLLVSLTHNLTQVRITPTLCPTSSPTWKSLTSTNPLPQSLVVHLQFGRTFLKW